MSDIEIINKSKLLDDKYHRQLEMDFGPDPTHTERVEGFVNNYTDESLEALGGLLTPETPEPSGTA